MSSSSSSPTAAARGEISSDDEQPPQKKKYKPSRKVLVLGKSCEFEWKHLFFDLVVYKAKHGDYYIKDNSLLAQFVHHIRSKKGRAELTADQLSALNEISFVWNEKSEIVRLTWLKMYEQLKEYKATHGHTKVPCKEGDLGRWASIQRDRWSLTQQVQTGTANKPVSRHQNMPDEFEKLLNEIDFTWKRYDRDSWEARFELLKQYKAEHGDCRVPQHFPENKGFGRWVARQRLQYNLLQQGKKVPLTPERIEQLESLGFHWGRKNTSRKK